MHNLLYKVHAKKALDIIFFPMIDCLTSELHSVQASRKVWAAKYIARHPNLVALELSSFKCGHDAPIYTVVEEIVEHSIDQDPRRDHRLLPEGLPGRYRAQQAEGEDHRKPARGVRSETRREMLRDKLDRLSDSFATGAMPQIHVTIGQLAASKPAEPVEQPFETVSGD